MNVFRKPLSAALAFAALDSQNDHFINLLPYGKLEFKGKAVMQEKGVNFNNGHSYEINLQQFVLGEVLGNGQHGIVRKVIHTPTNVTMAIKEFQFELDEEKLKRFIKELDVLHLSHSPYFMEFYGAFFIESCLYLSMEYMDAGSMDKLYQGGVREDILGKVALSVVLLYGSWAPIFEGRVINNAQ
ncbi:hypothetical protein HK096_000893, partial [Nowakowskiella sp. JEL0078]